MGDVVSIDQVRWHGLLSLFAASWSPLRVRFVLNHWLEFVSLHESPGEHSVDNLREALRYEWERLRPGRIPCRCGELTFPPATAGAAANAGAGGFGDIVPSIETAYRDLPIAWHGRTKVYLMLRGHTEQQIYDMRQDRQGKGSFSTFDQRHAERLRFELRRPGFRTRPQDADEEIESPWRRMASSLGWKPRELEPQLNVNEEQAA